LLAFVPNFLRCPG